MFGKSPADPTVKSSTGGGDKFWVEWRMEGFYGLVEEAEVLPHAFRVGGHTEAQDDPRNSQE